MYVETQVDPWYAIKVHEIGSDVLANQLPYDDWPDLIIPPNDALSSPNKTWFLSSASLDGLESIYLSKSTIPTSTVTHILGIRLEYHNKPTETLGQYQPGQDERIPVSGEGLHIQHDDKRNIVSIGTSASNLLNGNANVTFVGFNEVSLISVPSSIRLITGRHYIGGSVGKRAISSALNARRLHR